MSSQIIEVSTGDNAIQLGVAQIARTLDIGNTWNEIRIVARVKMAVATTFGGGLFYMGVQNGTTPLVNDAVGPGNFWGLYQQSTWTHNAGTPDYFTGANNIYCARKRGTTLTTPTFFSSVNAMRVASTDNHVLFGYQIDKTSPTTADFGLMHPNSTSVSPSDMTNADFLALLDNSVTPANYYNTTNSTSGGPWDVDEATYGNLDTVVLSWRSNFQQMIVADIGVNVIS